MTIVLNTIANLKFLPLRLFTVPTFYATVNILECNPTVPLNSTSEGTVRILQTSFIAGNGNCTGPDNP